MLYQIFILHKNGFWLLSINDDVLRVLIQGFQFWIHINFTELDIFIMCKHN